MNDPTVLGRKSVRAIIVTRSQEGREKRRKVRIEMKYDNKQKQFHITKESCGERDRRMGMTLFQVKNDREQIKNKL